MTDGCEWAIVAGTNSKIVADDGETVFDGPMDVRLARIICRDHNAVHLLAEVRSCETGHDENGHAFLKVPARSIFDLGARIAGALDMRIDR